MWVKEKKTDWELGSTANRYRVSFWGDGNVLESDSDDGCTTLNILRTTELDTLKWCLLCHVIFISIFIKGFRNLVLIDYWQ